VIEFVESKPFTRRLSRIAGAAADEVLWAIQSDLLKDPLRGTKVEGLGGIRKARTADPSRKKGKRGGFRYLYLYFVRDEQIALLYLFDKNEKEDLTKADKNILAGLAAQTGKANK
jgi:hypothetical protein